MRYHIRTSGLRDELFLLSQVVTVQQIVSGRQAKSALLVNKDGTETELDLGFTMRDLFKKYKAKTGVTNAKVYQAANMSANLASDATRDLADNAPLDLENDLPFDLDNLPPLDLDNNQPPAMPNKMSYLVSLSTLAIPELRQEADIDLILIKMRLLTHLKVLWQLIETRALDRPPTRQRCRLSVGPCRPDTAGTAADA